MPFRDLPPHLFPGVYLQNRLDRGMASHAYLLAGSGQEEAKKVALAYAQTLFCLEPTSDPRDACGHCQACHQVETLTHPDLHWLASQGRTLKIDDIRRLRANLSRTSHGGKGQVAVLDQAHQLTREGANALLKVLEEPPGPVTFFFLSDRSEGLPATILSRLQTLYFPMDPQAHKGLGSEAKLRALMGPDQEEDCFGEALKMRQALFGLLPRLGEAGADAIADFTGPLRRQDDLILLAVRLTKSFYADGLALAYDGPGPFRHPESPAAFQRQPLSATVLETILADCDQALFRLDAHVDGEHCLFLLLMTISQRLKAWALYKGSGKPYA